MSIEIIDFFPGRCYNVTKGGIAVVMPFMPEAAIRAGYIDFYADDDLQILRDVKLYNKYIGECRIIKKEASRAKNAFLIANPILLFAIIILNFNYAFSRGALALCALGLFIAAFVFFGCLKTNLIFAAAITPVLLVLDITFLSLVILNALFAYLYERYDREIRDHPTYPVFFEVDVHYVKHDRPKNDPLRRLG